MTLILKLVCLGLLVLLSACTTISPSLKLFETPQLSEFSHQIFDQTLQQNVDNFGRVDYQGLKKQPDAIEAYYQSISQYSPDSHPELFSSEQHRLAYWINAYNAAVITTVLRYYPIAGIEEVKPPLPLFFLPDKTGFFVFQRPVFGNVSTSLYYLENNVIRERFKEPRIHFALNCASRGCPALPNYAFTGDQLNQQLEKEAQRFFSESRNFSVDSTTKTVFLSAILDWYQDDFIDWLKIQHPEKNATLIDYVALYLPKEKTRQLLQLASDYEIKFIPYDWRLNDQKASK